MKESKLEEVIITFTKDEKNAISYFAEKEGMELSEFIKKAIYEKIREVAPEFQPSRGIPIDAALPEERMKEAYQKGSAWGEREGGWL